MPKEEGIVIKIVPEGAVVRVRKADACHGCPSATLCHFGKSGEREVLAKNPIGAKEGQKVEIAVKDGLLLKASFIVYILPLFGLLIGALLGRWFIRSFGFMLSEDTGAVIGGLTCLIAVFILIKIKSRSGYLMKKYQPTIIKTK